MNHSGYYDSDDKPRGRGKENSYSGRGTKDHVGSGIPVVTPLPASVSSSDGGLNPGKSKVRKLEISDQKDSLSPQPMNINPCLTMHQPWASLLVHGIKRIEGRSWPAPIRGRLWIHAASKVPEEETIKAMEDFYREIYALNGVTDIKFPERYPVSSLLGCIEVVGCLKLDEVANWEAIPEGVRVEGHTDFCWLCESPQKLRIPFVMRGNQGVYNLEKKIFESALRRLFPVKGPMPVKFPLPSQQDLFSLCPGSISSQTRSNPSKVEKSPSLIAAIESARAAATQFSKKNQNHNSSAIQNSSSTRQYKFRSKSSSEQIEIPAMNSPYVCDEKEEPKMSNESNQIELEESSSRRIRSQAGSDKRPRVSSKLFAAAIRGLKPS